PEARLRGSSLGMGWISRSALRRNAGLALASARRVARLASARAVAEAGKTGLGSISDRTRAI
ncbi:MAG TPA: hypothetical protein VMV44_06610, partial [Rectinemataceae bacterium]|nr:hypothetical protein [Rectinemataceae bacterium]